MGGGLGRVTKHSDYYLSDGSVSFLIENTLFRVHKSFFVRESSFFRDHFEASEADDPLAGTDESAYTLDVTPDEFAQLLWVWYDREYSYHKQTKANWITILRLATRWGFPRIKELAIRELESLHLSPAERISIYNEHGIDDDRLFDSYVEMCRSPELPTPADGKLLQMETLINILQAREDAQHKAAELGHESPTSASLGDETLREIVSRFFRKGLDPRSDGTSTGSGFQAPALNGDRTQRTSASDTITLGEPQVPERKAQPVNGSSSHTNSYHRAANEQGNQVESNDPRGRGDDKKPTTTTHGKEREEKARQDKEREEKERLEKARQEKEAKDKAQRAGDQRTSQTSRKGLGK